MSLRQCLDDAVAQGALNSRQADELNAYYEARFKTNRTAGMGEDEARRAARDQVAAEMRDKAAKQAKHAQMVAAKRDEIVAYLEEHRTVYGNANPVDAALSLLANFGFAGTRSMQGRAKAITSLVHRDLADVMARYHRSSISGRRTNKMDIDDLVRARWGDKSAPDDIRVLSDAVGNVFETLRQRFNAAGGDIPQRQDFDLTHRHDARKILALDADPEQAKAKWKAIIAPLLSPDQMVNQRTGETVGAAGLDKSLDYVFASIVSDGWAHRKPEARAFGSGALHSRYQDTRFLEFRDADAWLEYNRQFGSPDVIATIFDQVNRMAEDIAALETLGPNPDAMVQWLINVVRSEIGKKRAGLPSLVKKSMPGVSSGEIAAERINSLYRYLRGRETVWTGLAQTASDVRNVATSAMLGATSILAAATDPAISAASRRLAGLPIMKDMGRVFAEMAKDARSGREGARRAAKRAVIWEDYMHTLNSEMRFADQLMGHEWSKYVVDRSLHANLLIPLTNARKRVEAMAWHDTLGEAARAGTAFDDLDRRLKRVMEGFTLTADDWERMKAGVDKTGMLHPAGVLDATGDVRLAETYAEMIAQWNERAVPSNDPRMKSFVTGRVPRGTWLGELGDFATQFLSFSMSFTARQMEAIYLASVLGQTRTGKVARGAGYFTALAVPLTLGAAFYSQVKAVADGKDPEDVADPKFWAKSFIKGGGGGLFADFIDRTENRFGQSFVESLPGPGFSLIGETASVSVGNLWMILTGQGDDVNVGREASQYLGRYTPVLSSHPATRLAYRRYFIDNLQWLTDPAADKSFKAKVSRDSYWFAPGTTGPQRPPDPAAVWQTGD